VVDGWRLSTEPIPNLYGESARVAAENLNRIKDLPEVAAERGPSIDAGGRRWVSRASGGA
jgi:hypothetical protein